MEIYLVFVDAIQNSNKFWSAKVEGNQVTVEWGRVGYKSQTKIHSFSSRSVAVKKFHNLVTEKKSKGYSESQSQMNGNHHISDIRRAIQLLNVLRPYVANGNFDHRYIQALNEYLQIVPTPLGMQIDPYIIYRSVNDVDYKKDLLNSLLTTSTPQPAAVAVAHTPESTVKKVVSLKTISKNFWRHL